VSDSSTGLLRWLQAQVEVGRDGASATSVRLTCKCVPEGQGAATSKEIASWSSPLPPTEMLAKRIEEAIDADAASMQDPIAIYFVLPYFGDDEKPHGRFPIRRENPNLFEADPIEPQPGGLKLGGVGPRHLEGMWKLTAGGIAETVRLLSEQNIALTADCRKAQEMALQAIREQQRLLDENVVLQATVKSLKETLGLRDVADAFQ